jgi:DNA-binding transcriptional MerR regulator
VGLGEGKSDQAFRTIGELAGELGVPQHILRYWESRFPQLRPLQRAGNRRYYRPADVALVHRIHRLLNKDGYTIRGVQQLLAGGKADSAERDSMPDGGAEAASSLAAPPQPDRTPALFEELRAIRRTLAEALEDA